MKDCFETRTGRHENSGLARNVTFSIVNRTLNQPAGQLCFQQERREKQYR
jgi:hypothetical protein